MRNRKQHARWASGNLFLLLILCWICVGMGGCTAVRMVGMHQLGEKEAPVPEGGKISAINADGRIVPSVRVTIESPLTAKETVAWYRATLQNRGWILDKGTWDEVEENRYLGASRNRPGCGKETLELQVDEHETSVTACIHIRGEYPWDLPSGILVAVLHTAPHQGADYALGYSIHMLAHGDAGERVKMLLAGLPMALLWEVLCIPGDILWWTI